MIKRLIKIPTNNSKIYLQILSIMNFIIDATEQERKVLAEIICLNNEYDALEEAKRAKFILSTDMRREMRDNLDIGEKQFNTLLGRLKSKKLFGKPFLSSDGVLHSELMYKPDADGYEIVFKIEKDKSKEDTIEKDSKINDKVVSPDSNLEVSEEKKIPELANGDKGIIHNPHEGNITLV